MSEVEFVPGMYASRHEKAPDYVLAGISYPVDRIEEHCAWLREQAAKGGKYVNVQIKRAKTGKVYAALDTWAPRDKPAEKPAPVSDRMAVDPNDDQEIPF